MGTIPAGVSATLQRGQVINFSGSSGNWSLEIVGEINDGIYVPEKLKLFVNNAAFDILQEEYSGGSPIYCYSMAVLAKGSLYKPLNKDLFNNMEALRDQSTILWTHGDAVATYGAWTNPASENPETMRKTRSTDFLYFIVGIAGGIILTILYNFLIVWFRKREIAVLRAMGYKKGEIRINLVGESLTISFVGFVVGKQHFCIFK